MDGAVPLLPVYNLMSRTEPAYLQSKFCGLERANFHCFNFLNLIWQLNNYEFDFMY
jgi:hypothetical protein